MAITGTSTAHEIRAEYLNNMGYEAAGSLAMAQAFLAACMALVLVMPAQAGQDRTQTTFSPALINEQLKRVQMWISANPAAGGGGSRHFDLSDFRDQLGGCR